jgi:hypothetical protein
MSLNQLQKNLQVAVTKTGKKNKGKGKKGKVKAAFEIAHVADILAKVSAQTAKQKKQPTAIGKGLRALGAFGGSFFGAGNLGYQAGAAISRVFGQGSYMTNKPVQNSLMGGGPPSFGDLTSGFRVKHREYIRDINSSIAFASSTFSINPGLSATFPWLAQVAGNFEQYKIHGMVIYLNTTSATAVSSTNTALGIWGAVTQYEPDQPDFITKQQCENYVGAQSAVPCQSLMHGIECKPKSNVLQLMYVRNGTVPEDEIKFYDWGKLQIFTQGSQAASTIGEMWISYDVEFFKPRLPNIAYSASLDHYSITGAVQANPMGTGNVSPVVGSSIGTKVVGGNNQLVFPPNSPPGLYIVWLRWDSNTTAVFTAPAWAKTSNINEINFFSNKSTAYISAPQNSASQRFIFTCWSFNKTDDQQATITASGFAMSGTAELNLVISYGGQGVLNTLTKSKALEAIQDFTFDEILSMKEFIRDLKKRDDLSSPDVISFKRDEREETKE